MIFGRVSDFIIWLVLPNFFILAFSGCEIVNFQSLHSKAWKQGPNLVFIDSHTKMGVNM